MEQEERIIETYHFIKPGLAGVHPSLLEITHFRGKLTLSRFNERKERKNIKAIGNKQHLTGAEAGERRVALLLLMELTGLRTLVNGLEMIDELSAAEKYRR